MSLDDAELDRLRARRWQLLGVALLALVVLLGIAIAGGALGGGGEKGTRSANGIRGAKETQALLRGVPQRGLVLGRPDAPATITLFADLHCPFCRSDVTGDELRTLIDDQVRPGKANLELRLLGRLAPNSQQGRMAVDALAARGRAWNLAVMLFFNQGPEGGNWIDDRLLRRIGEVGPGLAGLPLSVREDAGGRRLMAETDALAKRWDVGGTPSYFVGARGGRDAREIGRSALGGRAGRIGDAVAELQP
ncbi:DsbA family protein [Patulibacter defluvii]|uniref:DsbA family protein n=1 Tax=Patulibacter defluvii TaxID=3095358 RepID=UPI002A753A33|nr:thioredoxin domain-containing protein [Patulibacter sp. DM4]